MHLQILTLILVAGIAVGCGRNRGEQTRPETAVEASGAVSHQVKKIVKAVADDDSVAFAALVSYPLQRPYPLNDINNAKEMETYYSVMVDDSLKQVLSQSKPENWNEYGWRGWSLHEGQYVWVDSLLYDVPYVSKEERRERKRRCHRELESLAPELQGQWDPVIALLAEDGKRIRIDVRTGMVPTEEGSLRMVIYERSENIKKLPSKVLSGKLASDGSALTPTYSFTGKRGLKVEWLPEKSESSEQEVIFTYPNGKEESYQVKRVYWLELSEPNDSITVKEK